MNMLGKKMCVMKTMVLLIFILLFSLSLSDNVEAGWLERVNYFVYSDLNSLQAQELSILYAADGINSFDVAFNHNEQGIKVTGGWIANVLRRRNYTLSFGLGLASGGEDKSVGRSIIFSGETDYFPVDCFYNIRYYINSNDWVYNVDTAIPVYGGTHITFGLGNTYWQSDSNFARIGLIIEM